MQINDLTQMLNKADKGVPVFKDYSERDAEELPDDSASEGAQQKSLGAVMRGPAPLQIYFYHHDHLGSSTFLTDGTGEVYQFYLNLPFGETMAEQHSLTDDYETPYKFNGKELDSETGLYYYGARYYDPRTSIWLSVDPLVEQTQTPYQYCTNNPINFIDPSGMSEKEWDYDIETHEMKLVGNKGGDTTDYINYKSGGETFYTKTKDVQHSTMTIGAMSRSESGKASVIRGPGFLSTWISEYKPADDSIESMEFSSPFFLWGAVLGNALKGVSSIFGTEAVVATEAIVATGGRLGNSSTRSQINAISSQLESRGYTITGGGGRSAEEYLRPLTAGRKGGSYLDITATHPNYPTLRINTIDVLRDGISPTARELRNATRIRSQIADGEHLLLIPKR